MKKLISTTILILFVLALGTAIYFYRQVSVLKQNPQAAAQEEAEDLVSKVGRLIVLPKDEVPTIATVSDPDKLKDQPFFAKAKIGDKVLLYSQAKKAYLYDPVANRILEVAPITVNANQGLDASSETTSSDTEESL